MAAAAAVPPKDVVMKQQKCEVTVEKGKGRSAVEEDI